MKKNVCDVESAVMSLPYGYLIRVENLLWVILILMIGLLAGVWFTLKMVGC